MGYEITCLSIADFLFYFYFKGGLRFLSERCA